MISEQNLVERSLRRMRLVRDQAGETVLLGTLGDGYGLVVEQVPSNQPVKFLIDIGHRFPLHTAAPGKALLASLPEDELEQQLRRMLFTRFNERHDYRPRPVLEELAEVRVRGYAVVDRGEEIDTLHCVAVAIYNSREYPVASMWVTGPSFRMKETDFENIASIVDGERVGDFSDVRLPVAGRRRAGGRLSVPVRSEGNGKNGASAGP